MTGGDGITQVKLTKKDFQSDQEVRWCPGCGDYAVIQGVQKLLAERGFPREKTVFVSGIGCSSRFPYYMNTYGFHTIHGRALAIATGLQLSRPDLQVWVITGDGDSLSIGGNHFIHALRRNVDLKILLFNNKIYGLTKGQFSPTSDLGAKTKSTPDGVIDPPFDPVALALGAGATFVARTIDVEAKHFMAVLERAAAHKGSAVVEILQNCVVFNDGAFDKLTDKATKESAQLRLEHGKPVRFGPGGVKGVKLEGAQPVVVDVGEGGGLGGVHPSELLVWDETAPRALGMAMTGITGPMPIGIFHAASAPTYAEREAELEERVRAKRGKGELARTLASGETWTVK